ncbi:MAG: OmpA family protein [Bacteroidota bacterium]
MRYCFLFILILCLWGCTSTKQLTLRQISGETDITKGSKAKLSWQFENADSVKIEGDLTTYRTKDSTVLLPLQNTTYRIVAYKGKNDSVVQLRTIYVDNNKDTFSQDSTQNNVLSINDSFSQSLRLVHKRFVQFDSSHHKYVFSIHNNQGFILNDKIIETSISFQHEDSTLNASFKVKPEIRLSKKSSIVIALDQSLEMIHNQSIINTYLYQAINKINDIDSLHFIRFNTSIVSQQILKNKTDIINAINAYQGYKPAGIRCIYHVIDSILKNKDIADDADIIVLTSGPDNGSYIHDAESIVKNAQKRNISIHVCNINNEVLDNYSLKYLASKSGGTFLDLSSSDTNTCVSSLISLMRINKGTFYEVLIADSILKSGESFYISVKLPTNDTVLSQKVLSNVDENSKLSRYKIVNLFYDSNTSIDTSFYLHIQNLGAVLKLNPTKIIEIIGYSSLLESNDDALALALQRASAVRKYLIMTGVDPNQIRIRGLSNIKPIYPDENEYYQTIMNRRVECRWIDPSLFPYEIRAEKVYTEQEALSMIEKWEKKKIMSYFDRRIQNGNSYYQILLWGYSTQNQMNEAISTLRKSVNFDLIPED